MTDDTRERILLGTLEILRSGTLRDFSMERVAAWIGVSRKTIYNHFPGKRELIETAVNEAMDRIIERLYEIADDESLGFVEKLDRVVEQGFREIEELWEPLISPDSGRAGMEISTTVRKLNELLHALIQRIVTEAVSRGMLAPETDPILLSRVILNMIEGIRNTDDPETLPCSRLELLRESLRISLVGALSPAGRELLRGTRILAPPRALP